MMRPILRSMFATGMVATFISLAGCGDTTKQITEKAASAGNAAADAASGAAAGAGDLMGKATEALSGVEGGSEMLKQASEMFSKITSTLGTVKDADTATAALPELGKLTEGFGGMTEMFGKMPDAAKSAVAGVFKSSIEQLKPILDKVLAIPGVDAILKPAVDALMSKLDAFKA